MVRQVKIEVREFFSHNVGAIHYTFNASKNKPKLIVKSS